ncbi:MAG TPA: acetoacetate decarboxylase family protein [Streptosporangiaceae bacterium]|nr:acetoacetate decarboxylase family protein [Streptosporangiaceae bacterium]
MDTNDRHLTGFFYPAWRGDATLELFGSPTEELARLTVDEVIGGYYRQVGVTWDGGSVLARPAAGTPGKSERS